jgi:hypothetical protein
VLTLPGNPLVAAGLKFRDDAPLLRRLASAGRVLATSPFRQRPAPADPPEQQNGYRLNRQEISYEALSAFRRRIKARNPEVIRTHYDREYLSWRVRSHPFVHYDEYQVTRDSQLLAYAFVALSGGQATISDLLSDDRHATRLLLAAITRDNCRRAGLIRFMGNPKDRMLTDVFAELRRFGFRVAMKWDIMVSDLSANVDVKQFYDIRNWHITGLWGEGFRY